MATKETYRIPTIEVETREDLVNILSQNSPGCVFEQLQEVLNPVGFQWNYTLTVKISSENVGTAIVKYQETVFEKPDTENDIMAIWLKNAIPAINCWYRGIIKP